MSVAGEGLTEPHLYFAPEGQNANRIHPPQLYIDRNRRGFSAEKRIHPPPEKVRMLLHADFFCYIRLAASYIACTQLLTKIISLLPKKKYHFHIVKMSLHRRQNTVDFLEAIGNSEA